MYPTTQLLTAFPALADKEGDPVWIGKVSDLQKHKGSV